ncbi:hypothetical protein DFH06DRAFT_1419588 [Mycena polygramma]|nr:hypothetical protein DFH06DRAFT_1419588 [Mycena polygramma]
MGVLTRELRCLLARSACPLQHLSFHIFSPHMAPTKLKPFLQVIPSVVDLELEIHSSGLLDSLIHVLQSPDVLPMLQTLHFGYAVVPPGYPNWGLYSREPKPKLKQVEESFEAVLETLRTRWEGKTLKAFHLRLNRFWILPSAVRERLLAFGNEHMQVVLTEDAMFPQNDHDDTEDAGDDKEDEEDYSEDDSEDESDDSEDAGSPDEYH